jgi:hypothetical protein
MTLTRAEVLALVRRYPWSTFRELAQRAPGCEERLLRWAVGQCVTEGLMVSRVETWAEHGGRDGYRAKRFHLTDAGASYDDE